MKQLVIYDINENETQDALRIRTLAGVMMMHGADVRFVNYHKSQEEFLSNPVIKSLYEEGKETVFPCVTLGGKLIKAGGYPTNEELMEFSQMEEELVQPLNCSSGSCGGSCSSCG